MNELQASLKIALANTFIMYFKAHSYHWNVEGMNFPQYHEFFGDLYDELYGAVDPFAEHIRAIDGYAPISLTSLIMAGTIAEDTDKPAATSEMVANLLSANNETIMSLNKAFMMAANDNGLQNFLADRLDIHAKHGWMLKSILK
jgi:starvation-inducible DNA-binding protein